MDLGWEESLCKICGQMLRAEKNNLFKVSAKHSITYYLQAPYIPNSAPCNFLLFKTVCKGPNLTLRRQYYSKYDLDLGAEFYLETCSFSDSSKSDQK